MVAVVIESLSGMPFFGLLKLAKTAHADGRVEGIAQSEIIINPELPALRDTSDL